MDIVERLRSVTRLLCKTEDVLYDEDNKLAFEAADEIERLREALKNIACINPSATNSSYLMRDVALTALQPKEGE